MLKVQTCELEQNWDSNPFEKLLKVRNLWRNLRNLRTYADYPQNSAEHPDICATQANSGLSGEFSGYSGHVRTLRTFVRTLRT